MQETTVYPLIPKPLAIETESVSGNLFIEGNLGSNYLLFRFHFNQDTMLVPLVISVQAAGKLHQLYCLIMDYSCHTVKTPMFCPEFFIGQKFTVTNVETLVHFQPGGLV